MSKFKVGDKVYCPIFSAGKIYPLTCNKGSVLNKPVIHGGVGRSLTEDGFYDFDEKAPRIFHATKENHELLSKLYPEIQFELPPLTSNEIVQNMLKEGKPVMCYLSDDSYDMAVFKGIYGLVSSYDADEGFEVAGEFWQYVVPMTYSDVMSKIGFVQEDQDA